MHFLHSCGPLRIFMPEVLTTEVWPVYHRHHPLARLVENRHLRTILCNFLEKLSGVFENETFSVWGSSCI